MIIEGSNTSNLTFNVIQLHFKSKVKIYTLVYNKFPNVRRELWDEKEIQIIYNNKIDWWISNP